MPIALIRHADAGDRRSRPFDDGLRPLSAVGCWQAKALADTLRPWAPQRVLSSPSLRCTQTVAPLAAALGLRTEVSGDLNEGCGRRALALVRALADDKAAVCTHGDVI